jgi:hypothetical protein
MALKFEYKESNKGRPKIDVEALLLKIYYEAPKGLTNEALAEFLGIATSTYCDLKVNNSEFLEATKHYFRVSPIEVLNSLKKLCVGYSADEETKELKKHGKELKMVTTKVVTKHFQPNATAVTFYLKNQMPEEFKDKVETVHSVAGDMDNITIVIKGRDKD